MAIDLKNTNFLPKEKTMALMGLTLDSLKLGKLCFTRVAEVIFTILYLCLPRNTLNN